MTYNPRAIPTRYAGHLFRSNLEARHAAVFDILGWAWSYETVEGDGKIIDFVVHVPLWTPILCEVRPVVEYHGYREVGAELQRAFRGWQGHLMVLGSELRWESPVWTAYAAMLVWEDDQYRLSLLSAEDYFLAQEFLPVQMLRCPKCGQVTLRSVVEIPYPCQGHGAMEPVTRQWAKELWGQAGEAVRYVSSKKE